MATETRNRRLEQELLFCNAVACQTHGTSGGAYGALMSQISTAQRSFVCARVRSYVFLNRQLYQRHQPLDKRFFSQFNWLNWSFTWTNIPRHRLKKSVTSTLSKKYHIFCFKSGNMINVGVQYSFGSVSNISSLPIVRIFLISFYFWLGFWPLFKQFLCPVDNVPSYYILQTRLDSLFLIM